MPETRSSLLFKLQSGDCQGEWQEFVETYQPLIEHFVRQAGIAGQDIDDVVQNVLLQLLRVLPAFTYQRSRGFFRSWLRRIASNKAVDLHRRRRSQPSRLTAEEQVIAKADSAEELSEIREFQRMLFQAALPAVRDEFRPRTWQAFARHILEHQTAADAGAALGMTENAVYINSSRVLTRIREFCAFHGEELRNEEALDVAN